MDAKLKYQTVTTAEEQHLAAMSSKKVKKTSKKSTSKKMSSTTIEEASERKIISQLDENFAEKEEISQKLNLTKKKKVLATAKTDALISNVDAAAALKDTNEQPAEKKQAITMPDEETEASSASITPPANGNDSTELVAKKKTKSKKAKKHEADRQNISVKSSFSKFDALQKRNLIHNPASANEINCRLCLKPVFKMEEIKAEKAIFHKNCFRCHECNKALKVDNYQSHESILYCIVHFKLLFAPKCVEDAEPQKPRKPELIIRENEPTDLPPDVVRACDKPDLGLNELSQLNLRSKFQVFENSNANADIKPEGAQTSVKRSSSMLSKLAKLQTLGFAAGIKLEDIESLHVANSSGDSDNCDDDENNDDSNDLDLVRSKKRTQRERPVGIGDAMNDIKTKFESGHIMSKEERREERKQEIQNIRNRLFLGKQARIKEMYQQAVADSEQGVVGKKPEIELECTTRTLKERFENGEMFRDERGSGLQDEADVFESAISKKSRSIFLELDANVAEGRNQIQTHNLNRNPSRTFNRPNRDCEQENLGADVVKHDEKSEDVKIETSDISTKFKFFETYRPSACEKKEFRITPPRDGVVKMPSPDNVDQTDDAELQTLKSNTNQIEKSQTTLMLNKFREMEQNKSRRLHDEAGPRPLKCFTPPPDGGQRLYKDQESSFDSQEDESNEIDDDEEEDEIEQEAYHSYKFQQNDEALKEAQAAARAKQLRAKFEKWEKWEEQRELNDGQINIYSQQVSDDTTIESAKSIRARFENLKNAESKSPARPRYQVNRFV